jgi:cobalt-precorrin-5B (C1)-methyltransferase
MGTKRLRSGFTTGACAAAAAKAAFVQLLTGKALESVTIPFPNGEQHTFVVKRSSLDVSATPRALAGIIKDAGDDPDITNGAEIQAIISLGSPIVPGTDPGQLQIEFLAGEGVGTITKPGLAVAVGEPAINPVPRQMITYALAQALKETAQKNEKVIQVTIQVPDGKMLAEKTLNQRLGIIGGISILGTTGIVRPVSAEAWTATIEASMEVARQTGCSEIVLSTGRTSEKGVQKMLDLPIEAFAMMGDYLQFSLKAAQKRSFAKVHLAAMWAKVLKAAMGIGQTHVRHGALEAKDAAAFIGKICNEPSLGKGLADANTAREIYERLVAQNRTDVVKKVCLAAKKYAEEVSGLPVNVYLVHGSLQVVEHV